MEPKREIQWYPGHMAKAIRQMKEQMKLVDLVIEVIDARIPASSRNPELDQIAQGKIRMIVMAKADLAYAPETERWLQYYEEQNVTAVAIDARKKGDIRRVRDSIAQLSEKKQERDRKRGIRFRPVRALIAGIPNVGKSTLINSLAARSIAKTGNRPGVTKGQQWIKSPQGFELLDTPGILWPKFSGKEEGEHLAVIGTMPDSLELMSAQEMAHAAISYGLTAWPDKLEEDFGITADHGEEEWLTQAACRLHALKSGSEYDTERAAQLIVDRFRKGGLGPVSLERAPDAQ